MDYQFKKHYTRDEARALLPEVRQWLARLVEIRDQLQKSELRMKSLTSSGADLGGDLVNGWVRQLLALQEVLREFQRRQILLKDLERGLVDFPSIIGGKEVFLCWEKDEEDIEFWHDLDTGYAGREKL